MKLHNTRTRQIDEFVPLHDDEAVMYSCGPTVYDHAHIGNLSSFIYADTIRRTVKSAGYSVVHGMNYTDVDDKTIRRSRERYPDLEPMQALKKLTDEYIALFLRDMELIGNDVTRLTFLRATDPKVIAGMQALITKLHALGFAYIADDGVYFSIDAYKKSGKTYGQLLTLTTGNTSEERIQNDEYDKESAHDFALWKRQKDNEPAWNFTLDGQDLTGRPGWHIECSVMSRQILGQPFDIHTGGVDLIFPHHENEIAQSTAGEDNSILSQFFTHNEHMFISGEKMSKSLSNFYTITDILDKGYDPLAFRLLVLQSHYRSQSHFSWDNLEAAQNRLRNYRNMAALRWQAIVFDYDASAMSTQPVSSAQLGMIKASIASALQNDVDTPKALEVLSEAEKAITPSRVDITMEPDFTAFLDSIDDMLGLRLSEVADISEEQKNLKNNHDTARANQDWGASDSFRKQLEQQGIGLRDLADNTSVWYRIN